MARKLHPFVHLVRLLMSLTLSEVHGSKSDNGASNWESDEPTARGIYVSLDFSAMTATLVEQYFPTNRNFSQSQGSMQVM